MYLTLVPSCVSDPYCESAEPYCELGTRAGSQPCGLDAGKLDVMVQPKIFNILRSSVFTSSIIGLEKAVFSGFSPLNRSLAPSMVIFSS